MSVEKRKRKRDLMGEEKSTVRISLEDLELSLLKCAGGPFCLA